MKNEEQSFPALPEFIDAPYHAIRKSDNVAVLCVTRAINEVTKKPIIVFGILEDTESTNMSFLDEDEFYLAYDIQGPVAYQYSIPADTAGDVSDTTGAGSIVISDKKCACSGIDTEKECTCSA